MMVGQRLRRRRNQRWEELDKRSIPLEQLVRHYVTLAASQVTVQHRKFSLMDRMELGKRKLSRNTGQDNNGNGSRSDKRIFTAPRLKTIARTSKRRN
jgi:hypothetical protein